MGASPAKRFGGRVSAGRNADLNSSQGDDHSTSRRGGSGHWVSTSGMVATSGIVWTTFWTALFPGGIRTSVVCQKGGLISAATSDFLASCSLGRFRTVDGMCLPDGTPTPLPLGLLRSLS